jgi:hypothetical protein
VREESERDERVDESPLTTRAHAILLLARTWLTDHRHQISGNADSVLADALATASRDRFLVAAKLHRALSGRDRAASDGGS